MISNRDLEAYIAELLAVAKFNDYAPNGLQIEGNKQISRIATAVSASLEVIQQAKDFNADALLVHHGYFWKGESAVICGLKKNRIASLINQDINLYAYHLPLDDFPLWGNNASIAHRLGLTVAGKVDLVWCGALTNPMTYAQLLTNLRDVYGQQVQGIMAHQSPIKHVAWCSGAAYDYFEKIIEQGIDAFITGEFSERTYHLAKESKINFFAAGHHATEKDGINLLGKHLADKFNLQHLFIDEDNPF